MLNLIFVEAALETIPPAIQGHPAVRASARRRGKIPSQILLDRSLHHAAMRTLPEAERRGRPDIIHFCLLEALGSPLNREGGLRIWVHTFGGYGIEVSPEARLPRDCNRFNGLAEQLFAFGRVPPEGGEALLSLRPMTLKALVDRIGARHIVALTSHGAPESLDELCGRLIDAEENAVFIGAYPSGPMRPETLSLVDEAVSIYPSSLEAWTVTSRLIYEFEKAGHISL